MNSYSVLKTRTIGDLVLIADEARLIGLYFDECDATPPMDSSWKRNPRHPILARAADEVSDFLAGRRTEFSIPLAFAGTPFQESVWRQIAAIPFGQTISYAQLAARVGAPKATRAAGTATGRNPLGIIIPCHRVLASNGGIGGYAGGLDRKKHLLELEGIAWGPRRVSRIAAAPPLAHSLDR